MKTPGGLILDQQNANPGRPGLLLVKIPGSVEQHAAVFNKTAMAGIGL